jgi:hypothetical protein
MQFLAVVAAMQTHRNVSKGLEPQQVPQCVVTVLCRPRLLPVRAFQLPVLPCACHVAVSCAAGAQAVDLYMYITRKTITPRITTIIVDLFLGCVMPEFSQQLS